ncbi:L,D-transpeptidase [Lysobacter brunescens]|uniref:L,D-transpeptidase n=1 Tax=Lysobacter brunescens TaxID=262323 RepID=A0ABW2YA49_9GAMM
MSIRARSSVLQTCALAVAIAVAMPLAAQTPASPSPAKPAASKPVASKPAVAVSTPVLKPGQFVWTPELAPEGPVVIVVSLPEQRAHVYRNGVRIGVSTVSTGMRGHETPTGVFTILEKQREHYSNLYDNAPMPFMQRLTWDGIALHAGRIPGYPASHGCVRLPHAFSEKLFATTSRGMTVVIADGASHPPEVASPGLFAPVDAGSGTPRLPPPVDEDSVWAPERAPEGPLTVLLSTRDQRVLVLRNGVEIGRARVTVGPLAPQGTQAYVLLEGAAEGPSAVLPDRPRLRWLAVAVPRSGTMPEDGLHRLVAEGQLQVDPAFARQVYDVLRPGATVVLTDEALRPAGADEGLTVLRADAPPEAAPPAPPPLPPAQPVFVPPDPGSPGR